MAENQIYVVKGRFKAMTTNTFGLLIIMLSKTTRQPISMSVIASHFSSMYENPPSGKWSAFEDTIAQMRYKGEISTNLSNDLQGVMSSTITGEVAEGIVESFGQKKMSKMEHTISSVIEKILGDKNIFTQFERETISQAEMEAVRQEKEKKNTEEVKKKEEQKQVQSSASVFTVAEGDTLLNVDLVLGPVSGIPIYELKPGDQIVVKIAGRTAKETYFIDLLKAKNEEGDVLPIKAVVKEIAANQEMKEYKLLVEIGPGIFGVASEQEQVKLKRYDPALDQRLNQKKEFQTGMEPGMSSRSGSRPSGPSPVLIIVLGAATLILFILFFVFFIG